MVATGAAWVIAVSFLLYLPLTYGVGWAWHFDYFEDAPPTSSASVAYWVSVFVLILGEGALGAIAFGSFVSHALDGGPLRAAVGRSATEVFRDPIVVPGFVLSIAASATIVLAPFVAGPFAARAVRRLSHATADPLFSVRLVRSRPPALLPFVLLAVAKTASGGRGAWIALLVTAAALTVAAIPIAELGRRQDLRFADVFAVGLLPTSLGLHVLLGFLIAAQFDSPSPLGSAGIAVVLLFASVLVLAWSAEAIVLAARTQHPIETRNAL